MAELEIHDLRAGYGDIAVLKGIGLEVAKGELVALVGSNGAGKSTLLRTISGLMKPQKGEISFRGQRIDHLLPHQIVELGFIQVPEGKQLFPEMYVEENLLVGASSRHARKERARTLREVYRFFPILEERKGQMAGSLSGGEQQMLAIGRSLMSQPKMLMLDEPSLGLAPIVVKTIFGIIAKISDAGVTILLVEQNVRQALNIAHRGYVMENGVIVDQGENKMILQDARIMKAYLGIG